ncbi:MAG: TonB-dependent receptor [Gemmatimonadota bacterium]|nr:TonB-dependent receptor [Gemmatimonadota bacterium]
MFVRRALVSSLRSFALAVAIVALPVIAAAQTGRLSGTVTDSTKAALTGTQVTIVGTGLSGISDDAGHFAIGGVNAGTYAVRAQRVGQRATTIANVIIHSGDETKIVIILARAPIELAGVVVSASRRTEKITEAPATVTRIESAQIENTVGNSFASALKGVKGLDFIQIGVMAVGVNARGFNTAFNNRVLQLEDGRISTLPESGLPAGTLTTIPKVDLSAVEVLVGPGSALYGPDASSGVITLTTKDPRDFPGTTLEMSSGSRSFYDVQGRQAGMIGERWGYKISGEYERASDWQNKNIYAPISGTTPSPEIGADFNTNVVRGEGALVYYFPGEGGRLELNGGASQSNALGLTNLGRNQLVDWRYGNAQLRYTSKNWFAQVYDVESRSGDTYQLNGFAQNRLRFPSITDDSVKSLSAFPDKARFSAAEIQNTFSVSQLNGTRFTYGAQFRHDDVSSMRHWLADRKTGKNVTFDNKGVYGQIEAPITDWLKLVGAARYDKHDYYASQWSPKGGILISPTPDQTFRVTYNRAFKSPSILQTSFFFPDFQPSIGVIGNRDGFLIKNAAGLVVRTIDPISPETNDTWELGYKGVLGGKLYLDAAGYYTTLDKFQSPLVIIANFLTPAASGGPTYAYNAKTGEKFVGATGNNQIALAYFNVGTAKIHGTDIGLRYLLTPTIDITGTTSLQKVDKITTKPTDPPEATAFNSPTSKFTVGMDFAELVQKELSGGFIMRYVNGYNFLSGVNVGRIPNFGTLDLSLGYRVAALNSRINLSVQNLFSCRSGTTTSNGWIAAGRPAIYAEKQECGFGQKHVEMLNSPEIGTMVFLGVRFER